MSQPLLFPCPARHRFTHPVRWNALRAVEAEPGVPPLAVARARDWCRKHPHRFAPERSSGVVLRLVAEAEPAHPEAYRLEVNDDGMTLRAGSDPGFWYGLQTVSQWMEGEGPVWGGSVEDQPDFARRGFMLDVSRCKVPTIETLFGLINLLADLRYNELQLYTEHSFAFPGHEAVWGAASPLTGEEIRTLDAYCRDRHIELVPNLNSFGHMDRWLRHPAYRHLAECPDGFTYPWGLKSPWGTTLIPDAASADFMEGLYRDFLPHFSSRQFNIGCDETWELGQGASKSRCAAEGRPRVYLKFLQEICRRVSAFDRTPQFWGDIILHQPDLIPELPRPITAMVWGYEADHPWETQCPAFERSGIPYYVCPGTSSWCSLVGRTTNARANLELALASGRAHGARGMLLTDWGDLGHHQPLGISYPPLFHAAALAWNHAANRGRDVAGALNRRLIGEETPALAYILEGIGRVQDLAPVIRPNRGTFHHFVFPDSETPAWLEAYPDPTLDRLERHLGAYLEDLAATRPGSEEGRLVREEVEHALCMARHGIHNVRALRQQPLRDAPPLREERRRLVERHRALWLRRNRSGGLAESCGYFDRSPAPAGA